MGLMRDARRTSKGVQIRLSPSPGVQSGYTLFDLLVVEAGAIPAWWVGGYFPAHWRMAVTLVLVFPFGIAFWCMIFLWLLPWRERHKKDRQTPPR